MCSFLSAKSSENARKIRKKIEVSQNFRADFFFRAENPLDRAMARASSAWTHHYCLYSNVFHKKN
jgi:hypothetical protein